MLEKGKFTLHNRILAVGEGEGIKVIRALTDLDRFRWQNRTHRELVHCSSERI
jgi:hypothetical protein